MWYNVRKKRVLKMEVSNATRFINAYNKIDVKIRALYNYKSAQSFSDCIRRSALVNSIIRKYEDELVDFARLRNAIVHKSYDEKIIAVPCDEAVALIEHVEKLLYAPPKIADYLTEKKIVSVDERLSIKQVIMMFEKTGHSSMPVYHDGVMIGIINSKRIVKEIGKIIVKGKNVSEFINGTAIGEILLDDDFNTYYKLLAKTDSLEEVLNAFEENKKLLAVVISEKGIKGERIVNFITAVDLAQINKILEEY